MGPVRHRLINLLSIVVVLQVAVALVALSARAGLDIGGKGDAGAAAAASSPRTEGGVLAAGTFTKRRGSKSAAAKSTSTTGPSVSTAPPQAPREAAVQATTSTTSPPVTAPATSKSTTPTATPSPTATSSPAPGGGGELKPLSDPVGDTVVDGTGSPITEARADIASAGAIYGHDKVFLFMQVQQSIDPLKDQRWAGDGTYVTWVLDTNGDATPDYEIQYFVADGKLGANVSRPGDDGEVVCDATAAYGADRDDAYGVAVDPGCLGNPASFSYRAAIFYDTNPADEDADVATDTAPNGGWSFPVARPA